MPDAFTNPAHVRFALKVTLAAMFCYFFYTGADWSGIHTAFITCIFVALETTGATLYKGILRAVGCSIGGLLALFSILVLIPHMETLASLVILVACVSAIAGWVGTGTERIAYAGLQMAFAFFYGLFPGFQAYAPDTDLTKARDRVVGILFGLAVVTFVFQYVWPERAMDRLRDLLRQALAQLARLLVIPSPGTPVTEARPRAVALIAEVSRELEKARRQAEVMSLEINEPRLRESISSNDLETRLSRAEHLFVKSPNWTPDGKALLINENGGFWKIPLLDPPAGGTPVSFDTGEAHGCWGEHQLSPDGKWLAVSCSSQGQKGPNVYIVPAEGGAARQLTHQPVSFFHGWSPDGKTIVFTSIRGGNEDIYTIPAAGGAEKERLTAQPASSTRRASSRRTAHISISIPTAAGLMTDLAHASGRQCDGAGHCRRP